MQAVLRTMEKLEQGKRAYLFLLVLGLLFLAPGLQQLPPTDRDESRFSQASKQMLETGNFIDIRLQDEARYKKPIGIYWLQAASVKLSGQPLNQIAAYRIPSLLGGLATILLCCYFGSRFFERRVGLLAGVLIASCLLLGVEARLAKTDASLLAFILLMQGCLGLIYQERHTHPHGRWPLLLGFWLACGGAILIKGPPAPVIAGLTIASLALVDRSLALVRAIRPLPGLLTLAIMVLPWLIAIQLASEGEFLQKALMGDFLAKIGSGQESHGAPPGYYLLLFPVLFWPGSLLAVRYAGHLWARRSEDVVRFLWAWILPAWLVFELVPTKLPHYILPFLPPLALLTAAGLSQPQARSRPTSKRRQLYPWLATGLWLLVSLLLGLALPLLPLWVKAFQLWHLLPLLGGFLCLHAAWRIFRQHPPLACLPVLVLGALLVLPITFSAILPQVDLAWPSRQVARLLENQPPGTLVAVGYREPSLAFLIGTKTRMTGVEDAIKLLASEDYRYLLLEERDKQGFEQLAPGRLAQLKLLNSFDSYNYSKGRKLRLELYAKE